MNKSTPIDEPNLDGILIDLAVANIDGSYGYDEEAHDKATKAIKALIANQVREARIDELKQLEPPDQFTHYIALGKTNYCSMCGFDAIEFKKHINDRIAELKGDDK